MSIILLSPTVQQHGTPDIHTLQSYHPEWLTIYAAWCVAAGLSAFGGGSMDQQGFKPGRITSAYRRYEKDGETFERGAHGYAFAGDVMVNTRNLSDQIHYVELGITEGYMRGGIYAAQTIVHFDLADAAWMAQNKVTKYWLQDRSGHYHGCMTIPELRALTIKYV